MPQYVVVDFPNGQVPADGNTGQALVAIITAADEHAARLAVAVQLNIPNAQHLYSTAIANFTDGVVTHTVS